MSLLTTLRFIINHPLNVQNRSQAFFRFLKWQIFSRLATGPIVINYVDTSKLFVSRGQTGATGNVYAGLHDFEDMAFVIHCLRPGDMFLDVGANVGSYTILASAVAGSRSIAFEPVVETYEKLLANLRLNNIADSVQALNVGVGVTSGTLIFTVGLDTMNHVASHEEKEGRTITVPVVQLDSMSLDEPLLLKIDVEGFETNVIHGAADMFKNKRILGVLMELNGSGERYGFDEKSLHSEMLEYGFVACRYLPFERKIVVVDEISSTNNTLYLRDLDLVRSRVKTAAKFKVNNHFI